jgi:organic radical activating enzyme
MKLAKLGDGPEIFHTLQGEGVSAGCPAVFVRASRCNLHCVWCDTDHTWNFTGTPWPHEKDATPGYAKFDKSAVTIEVSPDDIARQVLAYPCERLVLTGGEPLLQQNEFIEVIRRVRERKPHTFVEVETNGTVMPQDHFLAAVDQFNVSPKLANSGMPEALRNKPDALEVFRDSGKAWFKFVVADLQDISEIESWIGSLGIGRERMLLMPEGRTSAELDGTAALLAELCIRHGYRFSDRLHVRLWGDERGK